MGAHKEFEVLLP